MNIVQVNDRSELLKHREQIERLFFSSFGQRPIGEVWDWAYLDNPSGEPLVSLCYEDEQLVGHYAIVPMPLTFAAGSNDQRVCRSCVSMTTMVAESHRKFGLFTTLARATYQMAQDSAIDLVFGFPNSQSTPGFRNRLGWDLAEPDYVATVDRSGLETLARTGHFDKSGRHSLNLADTRLREWRLSRPGGQYHFHDGLAYKAHEGSIDLLWWADADSWRSLPENVPTNVLVTRQSGLECSKAFDYQFGGISLCSAFDHQTIQREMALSDLF